jgi:hypothetical protein
VTEGGGEESRERKESRELGVEERAAIGENGQRGEECTGKI